MPRAPFLYALLGAALSVAVFAGHALAAPTAGPSGPPGRWQIYNPTPEMVRNMMLIDSATGNVWVTCNGKNGERSWCWMPKYATSAIDASRAQPNAETPSPADPAPSPP